MNIRKTPYGLLVIEHEGETSCDISHVKLIPKHGAAVTLCSSKYMYIKDHYKKIYIKIMEGEECENPNSLDLLDVLKAERAKVKYKHASLENMQCKQCGNLYRGEKSCVGD